MPVLEPVIQAADQYIPFGNHCLHLTGDPQLMRELLSRWERFPLIREEDSRRLHPALLRLEKRDLFREGLSLDDPAAPLCDGWSLHTYSGNKTAIYAQNGSPCFFLQYGFPDDSVTVGVPDDDLFHLRNGVLYGMLTALSRDCIGLHGVTVQCGTETVILSAPSGTGKSTLARLLEEYGSARVINGDFALLTLTADGVMFEPTPFCGTSGICTNERARIDRIVFLEQADNNVLRVMTGRQAMTALMSNTFIPNRDDQLKQGILASIIQILSIVKIHSFSFAPDRVAAHVFLKGLTYQNVSSTTIKEEKAMDISKIPIPASKAEMDEIRKMVREELPDDLLDDVTGGNDGPTTASNPPTPWICPFCGATVMVRQFNDGPKHMTKCPNNPYR